MIKAVTHTQNYFQAPKNYFWQWADNGDVIQWRNGSTICYKTDLLMLLRELSSNSLPPLSPILLVLFACNNKVNTQELFFLIRNNFSDLKNCQEIVDDALKFMEIINNLPEQLRKGQKRIHLINEVFGNAGSSFRNGQLKDAIDELSSGRIDRLIQQESEEITEVQFRANLQFLNDALLRFPTVESLDLKLRSGIDKVPEAIDIALPENTPLDLFEQLEADNKTIGISRLAKHIIAALNIPMHSQGSGDQPIGGISDITNRGNYDKLLLSELAHDDDSLMARLVNNEALYFRREEPPENPQKQRTVLIDTTLKMWGIPRVFALSVALACAKNTKHREHVEAYSLGGEKYQQIVLDTKEGIVQSLEILNHSLHCGKALQAIIKDLPSNKHNDFFFITDASLLHSAAFHASLSLAREALSFILTVNRNGELSFYECIKGKIKLLSTAKFDLEDLLFTGKITPFKKRKNNNELPQFTTYNPAPLYYPQARIVNERRRFFYFEKNCAIAITETQRALYMGLEGKSAMEIFNLVETGEITFGLCGTSIFLMVNNTNKQQVWLYGYDSMSRTSTVKLLPIEMSAPTRIIFKDKKFKLFIKPLTIISYDPLSNNYITTKGGHTTNEHDEKPSVEIQNSFHAIVSPDNIITNIKSIYINDDGEISFGKHCITLRDQSTIKVVEVKKQKAETNASSEYETDFRPLQNKKIRFKKLVWNDGSEAIIDSRGLLHLKSSDESIPEITIVLVLLKATACWAADGTACGSLYFIDEQRSKVIPVTAFYKNNIQPFIDRIKAS